MYRRDIYTYLYIFSCFNSINDLMLAGSYTGKRKSAGGATKSKAKQNASDQRQNSGICCQETRKFSFSPEYKCFEIHTNQVMVGHSQSEIADTILRKSSVSDKGRSGKSQTLSFNITDSDSSIDLASDSPITSKSKGHKNGVF